MDTDRVAKEHTLSARSRKRSSISTKPDTRASISAVRPSLCEEKRTFQQNTVQGQWRFFQARTSFASRLAPASSSSCTQPKLPARAASINAVVEFGYTKKKNAPTHLSVKKTERQPPTMVNSHCELLEPRRRPAKWSRTLLGRPARQYARPWCRDSNRGRRKIKKQKPV
jgi:hypothetical protein